MPAPVYSGDSFRARAGAPRVTVPISMCSGPTRAMPPATQMEYLSLLLELRADAVLSVGLFVPMQGNDSVTMFVPIAVGTRRGVGCHMGTLRHPVGAPQRCTGTCQASRGCGDEDVTEVSQPLPL